MTDKKLLEQCLKSFEFLNKWHGETELVKAMITLLSNRLNKDDELLDESAVN